MALGINVDTNNIQIIIDSNIAIDVNKTTNALTLSDMSLTGLKTPIASSDAVNKSYVDSTPFIQLYGTSLPAQG